MVFGPSGRLFYAPKICQIPETDNNPDKTSGTFNGLKVRFFGTRIQIKTFSTDFQHIV